MGEPNRALIVVDVQNAFVVPSAGAPVEDAHQVVEAVNRCVSEAVDRGWPVFYTQDIAPFDAPAQELAQQVELYPGLDVRGTVVRKGPGRLQNFSSFLLASDHVPDGGGPGGGGLSELVGLLARADVGAVGVVGLAADVCVAATARDARRLGYPVAIPLGATAFVHAHPGGNEAALEDLRAAGVTVADEPLGSLL